MPSCAIGTFRSSLHAEKLLQRARDAAHNVHAVLQDQEDEDEDNDHDDSNDVILAAIGDEDETTNTATTRAPEE